MHLLAARPAAAWLERFPVGDGNLGAMIDGGTSSEVISLNHQHGWSGDPFRESAHGARRADAAFWPDVRDLLSLGRTADADARVRTLQGRYTQAFLPLADLVIERDASGGNYERRLDLSSGVHTVRSERFSERAMISAPSGVLVIESSAPLTFDIVSPLRETSRRGDARSLAVELEYPLDVPPPHEPSYPPAVWAGLGSATVTAVVTAEVVRRDDRWILVLASATTYGGAGCGLRPIDAARAEASRSRREALALGHDELFATGIASNLALLDRCDVRFTRDEREESPDLRTTGARLEDAFADPTHPLAADPDLAGLLFRHGRYLLASSSRPGGLPATLQGIWNDRMQPPWSSNYTLNVNLQMNYWAAHTTHLAETALPLREFVRALARAGADTAERMYGLPGWVAHHNSDAWLFTSTVGEGHGDLRWSHWPMGAAWLVSAVWQEVEFGGDDEVVRALWPAIRGAAEFVLGWQHRDGDDGSWRTSPATSPENTYVLADMEQSLATGSAMDDQLLRELYRITVAAAARLGLDDPVARDCAARRAETASTRIDGTGAIAEWYEDRIAADPHHRHVSHLWQLYPGPADWTDVQRAAAIRSLEARGDDSTGWSLIWKALLWARLRRPDKVSDLLRLVFRDASADRGPEAGGLYPNLFAAHPPFQIDANLGFPALVAECLVQSHDGIELLPAVPDVLGTGSARGLVARPGVEVDVRWRDCRLVSATLRPRSPVRCLVRYDGHERWFDLAGPLTVSPEDFSRGGVA